MGDLVIREARSEELDAIGELLVASFTPTFPNSFESDEERQTWDAYRENIRDTHSRAETSSQFVAEDGALVGAITYYAPGQMRYSVQEVTTPEGWSGIRLLGVHPRAQGRGIGRALTVACIELARTQGAEGVMLHTSHLMEVARGMYERMGFVRDPALDFFPVPGRDFTVMGYRLKL